MINEYEYELECQNETLRRKLIHAEQTNKALRELLDEKTAKVMELERRGKTPDWISEEIAYTSAMHIKDLKHGIKK